MYLIAALIGALMGARTARSRNGTLADILQYAAGYGIAFGLVGFILTIVFEKTVL
ncbi:MAG: hypothetical protein ACPGFC_09595 [Paracoccaceae bacterium]